MHGKQSSLEGLGSRASSPCVWYRYSYGASAQLQQRRGSGCQIGPSVGNAASSCQARGGGGAAAGAGVNWFDGCGKVIRKAGVGCSFHEVVDGESSYGGDLKGGRSHVGTHPGAIGTSSLLILAPSSHRTTIKTARLSVIPSDCLGSTVQPLPKSTARCLVASLTTVRNSSAWRTPLDGIILRPAPRVWMAYAQTGWLLWPVRQAALGTGSCETQLGSFLTYKHITPTGLGGLLDAAM